MIRDFDLAPMRDLSAWNGQGPPPAGPAINDPDLKKMTVTVTPNGNPPAGPIQISVIYSDSDNNGGGWIRLWADQSKTTEIVLNNLGNGLYQGNLANYPTSDFYVEGMRPSKAANDVKIRVKESFAMPGPGQPPHAPISAEQTLTVTPVVGQFEVTPKQGGQVTFLRNQVGDIVGLNSGTQAQNGGLPDGTDLNPNNLIGAGAVFFAVVEPRTGLGGTPEFLQKINVTNGNPAGVTVTGVGNRDMQRSDGQLFPILDSVPASLPFYPSLKGPNNDVKVQLTYADTPYVVELQNFNNSTWANQITNMDITYDFRLNLVWHFTDGTIYSLAKVAWDVVFRATTLPIVGLTISTDSVITAT